MPEELLKLIHDLKMDLSLLNISHTELMIREDVRKAIKYLEKYKSMNDLISALHQTENAIMQIHEMIKSYED